VIRQTRLRKGVSQRSLALRAGTSQSAIARIERGDEDVTWSRFRELMISLGEEPLLDSRPLKSRYDARDLYAQRRMGKASALKGGLLFNAFISKFAARARAARRERVG
jgi:transcriptional regulator with XRE-family HTH domain